MTREDRSGHERNPRRCRVGIGYHRGRSLGHSGAFVTCGLIIAKNFASHDTVNHGAEEYSRMDEATGRKATTNAVEGFFGNTKRSLDGTHHHVTGKYLPLYMAEMDHKYNMRGVSDGARTQSGIKGMEFKRLMLRRPLAA